MTLTQAIDAYLDANYQPQWRERVGDELRDILSEGDRVERPWVQHAISYMRDLGCTAI